MFQDKEGLAQVQVQPSPGSSPSLNSPELSPDCGVVCRISVLTKTAIIQNYLKREPENWHGFEL